MSDLMKPSRADGSVEAMQARISALEAKRDWDSRVIASLEEQGLLHQATVDALEGEIERRGRQLAELHRALASRDVIGQAKGIIMRATGCDAEQAFQTLVKQSQSQNRKLHDIALEIVGKTARAPS